jgi:hypothetical protein
LKYGTSNEHSNLIPRKKEQSRSNLYRRSKVPSPQPRKPWEKELFSKILEVQGQVRSGSDNRTQGQKEPGRTRIPRLRRWDESTLQSYASQDHSSDQEGKG